MQPFVNAKPIFIKNRRESVNFQAGFKCVFSADAGKKYLLRITGATLYSIWLNGEFVFYGPARAPHGYLRYDEIELDASEGENTLCVCLAGYNCPSFYTMNVEVVSGSGSLSRTEYRYAAPAATLRQYHWTDSARERHTVTAIRGHLTRCGIWTTPTL